MNKLSIWDRTLIVLLAVLAVATSILIPTLISRALTRFPDQPTIILPILGISGVIGLLAVLTVMVALFYALSLTNSEQALGLPEGSVRAVLALGLVVIFIIALVFVVQDQATTHIQTLKGLSQGQIDRIAPNLIISQSKVAEGVFDVVFRVEKSQTSQDLAKQGLTIVGTLLTAVVAFYFGTRAVTERGEPPGIEIGSPRSPASYPANGALEPITVLTTPRGEAINWSVSSGDPAGKLDQIRPGEFRYTNIGTQFPVTLKFSLVKYPSMSVELEVLQASQPAPSQPATA